jgi:geranylgeranyl transferase type-2 subunit beta
LKCQDSEDGGIADRPGNMADIFHTFFGICGLSLMKYYDNKDKYLNFKSIDPTYALPKEIVQKLGLYSQKLEELETDN